MLYSLSGLLPIPLGLHPCDLFMEISFQCKVLPAQDKRLTVPGIITRHKIMESQINGQFMSVLWKFFLARDLINNNNFTVSLLRRIILSEIPFPILSYSCAIIPAAHLPDGSYLQLQCQRSHQWNCNIPESSTVHLCGNGFSPNLHLLLQ